MTDKNQRQGPRALPSRDIEVLLGIMAALRDPVSCAWDREQDFASISRYTIEEAYEVTDAIARGDLADIQDELGDLLLQVVFHARIAEEQGAFDFGGVVEAITSKLIRRHPHVFGDRRDMSPSEVKAAWEVIKADERRTKATATQSNGVLDDVPATLPALVRTDKLARRAASVGFTWSEATQVLDKVEEELAELREAIASGATDAIKDELGDVLFTVANVGRFLEVSPDEALGDANRKFEWRFRHVEAALAASGTPLREASLREMEKHWDDAKRLERRD